MITLLSSILGFFGAAFPNILKFFHDRADRAHELAILDRQMELQKLGISQRLQEIEMSAALAETQALYQTYQTHVPWVDALNGTVRPVLAYAFFLLYAVTKFLQYSVIGDNLAAAASILWQEEDQAIFAGIISFYFGQRAMAKFRGGK